MGRDVGGGFTWRTHVNPWLIHVNVWQKPLQYCKVISLQLIKINGKNNNDDDDFFNITLTTATDYEEVSLLSYPREYILHPG